MKRADVENVTRSTHKKPESMGSASLTHPTLASCLRVEKVWLHRGIGAMKMRSKTAKYASFLPPSLMTNVLCQISDHFQKWNFSSMRSPQVFGTATRQPKTQKIAKPLSDQTTRWAAILQNLVNR